MNLHALFEPASIAVVGASTELGSVGNDVVKNLVEQGYAGMVYPVNPKTDSLYNLRCFPALADIDGPIDLAVVVVPAPIVPRILREAAAKGIPAALVISAGFSEAGKEELEKELAEIARGSDMALLGPNCLGIVNPHRSMNASFAKTLPKKGNIAFLSQSGALGTAVLDMASSIGIGFSTFVSLGNKAVLDESALLHYFADDPKTAVIAVYAEALRDPESIKSVGRALLLAKKPKPIVVLKSGKTTAGRTALSSHTGSIAGNDASYEALFEEAGIFRAKSAEDLFLLARAFSLLPPPSGKNLAILTNAGGPGVLAADESILQGLALAPLSNETKSALRTFLPAAASVGNPVDILGDARSERYARALECLLSDSAVHMALVVLTPQSMTDSEAVSEAIASAAKRFKKPVVAALMGGKLVFRATKFLMRKKIPVVSFPEDGVRMLSALADFSERAAEAKETNIPSEASFVGAEAFDTEGIGRLLSGKREARSTLFSPLETLDFLGACGFRVVRYRKANTASEAEEIGRSINAPLALKILSEDITHKTDAGGVLLNVLPERAAYSFDAIQMRVKESVPEARLEGVLFMEMAPPLGIELILGSFRDANLGHTVMVGAGGIFVETLKDASFGLVPISRRRAEEMLAKLRIFPILDGARGTARYDTASVVDSILRLSAILERFPDIRELDINPLIVYPEGLDNQMALVVDGRILL